MKCRDKFNLLRAWYIVFLDAIFVVICFVRGFNKIGIIVSLLFMVYPIICLVQALIEKENILECVMFVSNYSLILFLTSIYINIGELNTKPIHIWSFVYCMILTCVYNIVMSVKTRNDPKGFFFPSQVQYIFQFVACVCLIISVFNIHSPKMFVACIVCVMLFSTMILDKKDSSFSFNVCILLLIVINCMLLINIVLNNVTLRPFMTTKVSEMLTHLLLLIPNMIKDTHEYLN